MNFRVYGAGCFSYFRHGIPAMIVFLPMRWHQIIQEPIFRQYVWPKFTWSFLSRLVGYSLGFFIHWWLARLLGAAGYGGFAFAFNTLALLALIAGFGMRNLLTREVAQLVAQQQWTLIRGLQRFSLSMVTVSTLLVILFTYAVMWFTGWPADPLLYNMLQLALPGLFFFAMVPVWQGWLMGLHHTGIAQVPESIVRPVVLITGIGLWMGWQGNLVPATAVLANVIALGIAFLTSTILVYTRQKKVPKAKGKSAIPRKRWFRAAFFFLFIGGMHLINSHMDMLMVGSLMGAEPAGVYHIPVRLGALLLFPFLMLEMVFGPLIAKIQGEQRLPALQTMLRWSTGIVLLFTAATLLAVGMFSTEVLGWFGPAFIAGRTVLLIFMGIVLLQIIFGPAGQLLTMTGHETLMAKIMAFSGGLNIVLNLILIPQMGIEGAAIATLTSELVWKSLMYWKVRTLLHLKPGVLPF